MTRSLFAPFRALALLVLSGFAAAQGQVLVVDAASGPGTDFTQIAAAVAAASDQDTILVRRGLYAPFVVSGKSLVIAADTGANVTINVGATSTRIADLGASQSVVLRGLQFGGSSDIVRLEIDNNAGRVWVENVVLGFAFFLVNTTNTGEPVIRVTDTTDASFLNCQMYGGYSNTGPGGTGIVIESSDVQMFGCTARGGDCGPSMEAPGARLISGELVLTGCTIVGSDGAQSLQCFTGYPGGPGLRIDGGQLWRIDTAIEGGRRGWTICSDYGPQAPPILQNGGTIHSPPGAARSLAAAAPVREGTSASFTFEGLSGDIAFLLLSLAQDPHRRLLYTGVQFLQEPFLPILPAGILTGAPATAQLSVLVPNLALPIEGWVVYAQGAFLNSTPDGTPLMLGSATAVPILDPAF